MPFLSTIRKPISRRWQVASGFAAWAVVVAVWFAVTRGQLLPPLALPDPAGVVAAAARLWTEYDLLGNVFQSWWRIAQAFLWSALVAVPLGLLMGGFPWLYHLVNPIAAPMRGMPITAFLPAFIALLGMDEAMKVGFLVFGMLFYLLAVVVDEVNKVDDALLETAYTLGARTHHVLWLLFRASFPAVFGSFRILYDIGWTYVILAEMVNARKGVGYMVEAARKVLDFERVYAGIIAIGVAAFLFRWLLTALENRLFPWQRPARPQPEPAKAPQHGS
ncbi:MAG: ABC transporter permease subunit [Acidobacteria bacterium]|nr:ABC transporter permease subunit [Acidobacteriota bacterium]